MEVALNGLEKKQKDELRGGSHEGGRLEAGHEGGRRKAGFWGEVLVAVQYKRVVCRGACADPSRRVALADVWALRGPALRSQQQGV